MSQADTTTYWNQIQAPGSPRLAQVLLQSGRLNQSQLAELRRRYQAQQRKPVTLPVGDATSSQEVTVEQAWNEALDRDRVLAEVLMNRRLVPLEQLQECRQIQRDQQLRLGVVIVKKGYLSRGQIESAIGEVRKIGNGRLPWTPQFFEGGAQPAPYTQPPSGRHTPASGRHEPPLVASPRDSGRADFARPVEAGAPSHGSQRLARDAAAASRSGSGRHDEGWLGAQPPPPSPLARTLEDENPFASVRNTPVGPGDPLFVPLEPEDVRPKGGAGLGLPPVVSPQEDGMPTVIHRAVKPQGGLPAGLSPSDLDDATILGGNSLDELNPFANFPMQPPLGDSAAITIETPEAMPGPEATAPAGWGDGGGGGWSGSDMDILPSQSESGLGTTGGFAPIPGGGSGFAEDEVSGSDGFKISAQGGGDLPLSESGPSHAFPEFGAAAGGGNFPGMQPIEGGEHSPAPAALVAASASSRERAKASRLDKNTKLLRMLIGLCVGIFVISLALMAYILLFSEQPPPQDGGGGGGDQQAPETPGGGEDGDGTGGTGDGSGAPGD